MTKAVETAKLPGEGGVTGGRRGRLRPPSVVDAVECGSRCRHLRVAPPSSWLSPSRSWRCEMPSIVGTWKLVDATARDAAGTARPAAYGGHALGRVTFTAHGRMMSVVCDGRPELPVGATRE